MTIGKKILCFFCLFFVFFELSYASDTPQLQEYSVRPIYKGKVADVVLSNSEKRLFRTRLRATTKKPVNFAGEYVLTLWGCGANCLLGAAVSQKTGYVVFLPASVCCWHESSDRLTYQANSRLLIAKGILNESSEYGAHFYEFTGQEFKLIKSVSLPRYF
ncbi:hypothetical protein [Candidatus Thioglobus sp.]|uniref:hypothetical protein n=1 Tax=Candidatus Thioglobus sp. TaxID=2026721 RepID=UPI003D11E3EF